MTVKFNSKAIAEHAEVPLADDGQLESLVAVWDEKRKQSAAGDEASRCYVASVGQERDPLVRAAQLSEIVSLVRSQGGVVVGEEVVHLHVPNPKTLLGKGAVEQLAERARQSGATLLVLDAELSPSQTRNIEDAAGIAVCDREAVILNVFLKHAKTRRSKIQVEIAQLEYLRPRIRGVGLDMDQQTGGMARARGPGETASELLARKLDGRLLELQKSLKRLETSSRTQRSQRAACKRLALVGYTNAGKTSLMNALTRADLSARDMPFETLDTTSRALDRHGGEVLLSDTVGFIRRLPQRLLASFESTLAEIVDASLLVVVVDISDYERAAQLEATVEQLERLGAAKVPRFYVFNKLDRLSSPVTASELEDLAGGHPYAAVSSQDATAMEQLATDLLRAARRDETPVTAVVPYEATELLAHIYASCRVTNSEAREEGLLLSFAGPVGAVAKIRARIKELS